MYLYLAIKMLAWARSSDGGDVQTVGQHRRKNLSMMSHDEAVRMFDVKDPQETDKLSTRRLPSDPIPIRRITSAIVEPVSRTQSPLIPVKSPDSSPVVSEMNPDLLVSVSPPRPPSYVDTSGGLTTLKIRELDKDTADALAFAMGAPHLSPRMQRARTIRHAATMELKRVHLVRKENV